MSINSVTFFSITVGLGAFIYHERYVNKPHTLDDGFSDSGGCSTSVDDSIGRVSHIDCSGLDITTVSSFHSFFDLAADAWQPLEIPFFVLPMYRLFFLRSIAQFFTQIYMNCFVSS